MLGGRLILPHVRQRSWRSANSRDVGGGGVTRGIGLVVAGTVSAGYYMHSARLCLGLAGTRTACSLSCKRVKVGSTSPRATRYARALT